MICLLLISKLLPFSGNPSITTTGSSYISTKLKKGFDIIAEGTQDSL